MHHELIRVFFSDFYYLFFLFRLPVVNDCPAGQTARVTSNQHLSSSSSNMAVSRVPSPPLPEVNTPVAENWCYTQVRKIFVPKTKKQKPEPIQTNQIVGRRRGENIDAKVDSIGSHTLYMSIISFDHFSHQSHSNDGFVHIESWTFHLIRFIVSIQQRIPFTYRLNLLIMLYE